MAVLFFVRRYAAKRHPLDLASSSSTRSRGRLQSWKVTYIRRFATRTPGLVGVVSSSVIYRASSSQVMQSSHAVRVPQEQRDPQFRVQRVEEACANAALEPWARDGYRRRELYRPCSEYLHGLSDQRVGRPDPLSPFPGSVSF